MTIICEEEDIVNMVRMIRTELQQIETLQAFEFTIRASGRVHEGDIELTFKLDHPYESGVYVTGNTVAAVLQEFMRRHGWNKRHMPLMIGSGEVNEVDNVVEIG